MARDDRQDVGQMVDCSDDDGRDDEMMEGMEDWMWDVEGDVLRSFPK